MADVDLLQRLDAFESRLYRLEELLGLHTRPVIQKLRKPIETAPPPLPAQPPLQALAAEVAATQAPILIMPYQSQESAKPIPQSDLEQTIGLKWAGWIGAVVLVIGAGLGIRFGYDQGWFMILPPAVRLIIFALFGLGLIAAGEWVFRRVNKLSAAGLFGAGVAVLFVVSYSGHAFYDLYPRNTAFSLMGVATVIGGLVSRRGNMVSVAVLSLIGGNLAPLLLSQGQPELSGFLVYLLMLQIVALTLAAWGAQPKWWTVRGLSLATTCLWMGAVIDLTPSSLLLVFSLLFAGLFQLELLLSAWRSRLAVKNAGTTFSMLVSAAAAAAALYLLRDGSETIRLSFVLGFAGLAGMWSALLPRMSKTHPAMRELATGYTIQAMALVALAVPIAFSGIWISCAWAVLAIAFGVLGYVLDQPMARYASPVVWLLAIVELTLWTMGLGGLNHHRLIGLSVGGIDFHQHTLMNWLLALLGQLVAKMVGSHKRNSPSVFAQVVSSSVSVISSCVWVFAALAGLPPMMASASVLGYAALLALLDFVESDLNFLVQAAVLIALAAAKWAFMDTLGHRLWDPPAVEPIFFGVRGFTSAILLVSLMVLHYRAAAAQTNRYRSEIKKLVAVLAVGAFFWLGTFGIDQGFINLRSSTTAILSDPDRAEQVAFSIFWSCFALASVAAGFGWRTAGLRYFGLALFAVTLLKVVSIDLNQVSTGYRILSFMGLGILLLGTSGLYGKVSPLLLATHESKPQGE
jgi:uncharacterized membrane protein